MTGEIWGGILLGILLGILEISWLSKTLRSALARGASSSVYSIILTLLLKLVGLYLLCWQGFKLGLTKGLIAMIIAVALTMCVAPIKYMRGTL